DPAHLDLDPDPGERARDPAGGVVVDVPQRHGPRPTLDRSPRVDRAHSAPGTRDKDDGARERGVHAARVEALLVHDRTVLPPPGTRPRRRRVRSLHGPNPSDIRARAGPLPGGRAGRRRAGPGNRARRRRVWSLRGPKVSDIGARAGRLRGIEPWTSRRSGHPGGSVGWGPHGTSPRG